MIEGFIVNDDDAWIYQWFGYAVFSPNALRSALRKANGAPVTVRVNSPGGEVTSASVIYTDLREYAGDVTVKIIGMAASAASVISMAGDKVLMSPTAEMMIHNSQMGAQGDHVEMERAAGILRSTDDAIVNAYLGKTDKLTKAQLKNMMGKETWFNASEAQDYGLIDAVMFQEDGDPKLAGTEPNASAGGVPGARAASQHFPSVATLTERKRVWDELVPGAVNLAAARATLVAAPAEHEPPLTPAPTMTTPIETTPTPPNNSAQLALLRAQIDLYAEN